MTAIFFPDCCVFDNSVIKRHSFSYSQAAPLLDMNPYAFSWLTTRGSITIGSSPAYSTCLIIDVPTRCFTQKSTLKPMTTPLQSSA